MDGVRVILDSANVSVIEGLDLIRLPQTERAERYMIARASYHSAVDPDNPA
jgi:hypothetical protein